MKNLILILILLGSVSCYRNSKYEVEVQGELKRWHKIELIFNGPETSEWDKENPFLNYKLEVSFTKGSKTLTIPGFYTADGITSESSSETNNK